MKTLGEAGTYKPRQKARGCNSLMSQPLTCGTLLHRASEPTHPLILKFPKTHSFPKRASEGESWAASCLKQHN